MTGTLSLGQCLDPVGDVRNLLLPVVGPARSRVKQLEVVNTKSLMHAAGHAPCLARSCKMDSRVSSMNSGAPASLPPPGQFGKSRSARNPSRTRAGHPAREHSRRITSDSAVISRLTRPRAPQVHRHVLGNVHGDDVCPRWARAMTIIHRRAGRSSAVES